MSTREYFSRVSYAPGPIAQPVFSLDNEVHLGKSENPSNLADGAVVAAATHVSFPPRSRSPAGLEASTAERKALRRADHFADLSPRALPGLLAPSIIFGDQGVRCCACCLGCESTTCHTTAVVFGENCDCSGFGKNQKSWRETREAVRQLHCCYIAT